MLYVRSSIIESTNIFSENTQNSISFLNGSPERVADFYLSLEFDLLNEITFKYENRV